jgi:hypothetical protein
LTRPQTEKPDRVFALLSEHATSLHWQYITFGSKHACTNANEASKLFLFFFAIVSSFFFENICVVPCFVTIVVVTPLLCDLQTDLYLLELDDYLCQPQKGHAGTVCMWPLFIDLIQYCLTKLVGFWWSMILSWTPICSTFNPISNVDRSLTFAILWIINLCFYDRKF